MKRELSKDTVELRLLEEVDLAAVHAMRSENAESFFGWEPLRASRQRQWFESIVNDPSKLAFVLVLKSAGYPIGYCQVTGIDHRNKRAEVGGFMIRREHRRKGYGLAMVEMLADFCLVEIGLRKLYLEVFTDNEAAILVYKKAGFAVEGVRKQHVWKDGRWRDVLLMARF